MPIRNSARRLWRQLWSVLPAVLLLLAAVPEAGADLLAVVKEGVVVNGDQTLYTKTLGEGEPLLVLHGGPGFDHRQFLPYIWELARGHQVILYDQRGTGLSEGPVDSTTMTLDTFIDDIEAVRRAFGIERLNLLGHSWGGTLAMYYALRHPEHLRSLILCSTAATSESSTTMQAANEAARVPGDYDKLVEIYRSEAYQAGDPQTVTGFWRLYFKPYFKDQSQVERMDLQFPPNTIRYSEAVAGYVLKSIGDFDLHADLGAVRCPTLIVHGEADTMSPAYAERIHAGIPGSELVIVPDAGHWLFVDGTEVFTRSILEFLARVGDRPDEPAAP